MKIVSYYRVVTGVGFLTGVIMGALTTWMFVRSGRSVILGIFAFIPVFSIVFLIFTFHWWKKGSKLPIHASTVLMMDPRGPILLPRNYGPPLSNTINAVLYYNPGDCPTREDLIKQAVENCKKHSRFRKTPRFNFDEPLYSSFGDPELKTEEDVARHIVDRPLVRTEDQLRKALEQIEALELLENAPAWMMYRIPSGGTARACTLMKVSHLIGDALRLAIWGESIMTTDPVGTPCNWGFGPLKGITPRRGRKRPTVRMNFLPRLKMNIESIATSLNANNNVDTVTPFHPATDIFKGKMVTSRMKPIPLNEFKRIALSTKSTINDILTATLASAIRRYCLHIDPSFDDIKDPKCRGILTYGFPCKKGFVQSSEKLFNDFTSVPIVLPIGVMTCRNRLATAKKTLFKIKNTVAAWVISWMVGCVMKLGGYNMMKKWGTTALSNISCVYSNVRGPPTTAFYCGKEIVHLEVSLANYTNMFIFLSYKNMMGGTFTTDMSVVKEPQVLVNYINEELYRFKDELVPSNQRESVLPIEEVLWG